MIMYSTCCNVQRRCDDAHPVSLWVPFCSKNKERLFPIIQQNFERFILLKKGTKSVNNMQHPA